MSRDDQLAFNALRYPARPRRPRRGGRRLQGGGGPFLPKAANERRADRWRALRALAAFLGLGS